MIPTADQAIAHALESVEERLIRLKAARMRAAHDKRIAAIKAAVDRNGGRLGTPVPQIRRVVSPRYRDPADGLMTRTTRAAD